MEFLLECSTRYLTHELRLFIFSTEKEFGKRKGNAIHCLKSSALQPKPKLVKYPVHTSEDADPLNVWFFVLKLVSWFFVDFEEDSDLLLLTLLEGLVNK